MRKYLLPAIRYLILAAVIVFGIWYVRGNYGRFAERAHITAGGIALLAGLNVLTLFSESIRLKFQVRKLGYNLPLLESWHILTVLQAANHVILKAGTFSAGYYLSKRYRISFNACCAFVVTYVVVMVLASGIFGLAVVAGYMACGTDVGLLMPVFFVLVILACTSFISIAKIDIPLGRLPLILQRFIRAWREIYSDNSLMLLMITVEMLYFLSCSLRLMAAMAMLSYPISFINAVAVVTIGNFLRVASIVPGGLGIAEVASGWTAALFGGDAGATGLAAGLDRIMYIILLIMFGGIGFLTLSGRSEFHKPSADINFGNVAED
jgi:uncharacterized protein (TIRG00374 family)